MVKNQKQRQMKRAAAKRVRNGASRETKAERRSNPGRLNSGRSRRVRLVRSSILSRPAEMYAMSLANPFTGPVATVPDYPNIPSRRLRVFAKGTASASSTTGFGFVVLDPYRASTNDLTSVFTSSTASTVTAVDVADANTVKVTTNSDYASTDYGTGTLASGRVVSAGIRVRYSGTQLNRGGLLIGFQHPTHQTINTLNQADIEAYDCAKRFIPGNGEFTVLFSPVLSEEMQFTNTFGGGNLSVIRPVMGFVWQAPTAAAGATYSWEVYVNIEVNGQEIRGMLPSVSDPAGFAAVQNAAQVTQMRPHSEAAPSHASKFAHGVEQLALSTLTGAAQGAGKRVAEEAVKKGAGLGEEVLSILGGAAAVML